LFLADAFHDTDELAALSFERLGVQNASRTPKRIFMLETILEEDGEEDETTEDWMAREYRIIAALAESSSQNILDGHVDIVESAIREAANDREEVERRKARRHAVVIAREDTAWSEWSGSLYSLHSDVDVGPEEIQEKHEALSVVFKSMEGERPRKRMGLRKSLKKIFCHKRI
jgi:hypothetical protein